MKFFRNLLDPRKRPAAITGPLPVPEVRSAGMVNARFEMVPGLLSLFLFMLCSLACRPTGAAVLEFNDFAIDVSGRPAIEPKADGRIDRDAREKWIVRFTGPVREAEKKQLSDLDCRIEDYIPDFAFLVTMDDGTREEVERLLFVQGVARYKPEHKVRKKFGEKINRIRKQAALQGRPGDGPAAKILVRVDSAEGLISLLSAVHAQKGEIIDLGHDLAAVRLASGAVSRIAELEEVLWIEEAADLRLFNDTAAWTMQSSTPYHTPIWDRGIRGQGQIVAIGDTGLDYDMPWFHDPVNNPIGPAHRKVVDYTPYADDYDGDFGHGTHVACTVAGNRTPVDGLSEANGMAPGARLFVQDITPGEQTAVYPPSDLGLLFATPYSAGARLHTNSWGAATNLYETYARSADRFMWEHKNFLAFFANGNTGPSDGTVGTPATAKNAVSVGATENGVDAENLASFSSNGSTTDGRIKPTVTAPGVAIISADSDGLRESFNSGTISLSGTSMATPVVAGAAALVRQYYLGGYWPFGTTNAAYGFEPSAALVKATLINSGRNMTGGYTDGPIPSTGQGWGRVSLADTLHFFSDDNFLEVADVKTGLSTGTSWSRRYFATGDQYLKVTLVWTDYPGIEGAVKALVNDLDLQVITPDGMIFRGNVFADGLSATGGTADRLNVEEQIYIPTRQSGDYTVRVSGYNVPFGPQPFAVVVTGAVSISSIGFINLDKSRYNQESMIEIQVADRDLNTNSSAVETAAILINSTSESGGETVQLVESGPGTSIFTGSIPARPVPATANNGRLEIRDGDAITATYLDADDGTGKAANRTATAIADLIPPVISGVTVSAIGQDEATVSWTTNEPIAAAVHYGENPDSPDARQEDPWLLTSPVVHLANLREDTTYFAMVSSTDEAGNISADDNGGRLYSFATRRLPPDLTFNSSNLDLTYQTETVLYGTATDPSGIATIRISGPGLNQSVSCRASDGYYELHVPLAIGDNPFSVTATDNLGNPATRQLTVTRLQQPDLAVISVTAPTKGGFFQPIEVETTVCNLGPGISPGSGRISWYLSTEQDISAADTFQLGLEYSHEDDIPPGECISVPVDIRLGIPLSMVWKTYYLAARVDSMGFIWEADETNNIRFAADRITIEGADLEMSALSGPGRVDPGDSFTVANTVRNIGLGTSIPFEVAIYLSTDAIITTDDTLLGSRFINYLEPVCTPYPYPSESSQETEVSLRSTVPAGDYYLGAIAAPGSTFYEPDKNNNVFPGGPIRVGDPDVVPPTIPAGLSGTALGYNRIYLAWTASTDFGGTGVAGYHVYRGNTVVGSTTAATYIDAGLVAATAYSYSVAAFDREGNLSIRSAAVAVTTAPLPAGVNQPPSVAGSPPDTVAAGEMYEFIPSASDPNHDMLRFTIINKPGWAGFNEVTGALQGVPGDDDIGVHGPITITVHDPYGENDALQFTVKVIPGSGTDRLGALRSVYMLLLK